MYVHPGGLSTSKVICRAAFFLEGGSGLVSEIKMLPLRGKGAHGIDKVKYCQIKKEGEIPYILCMYSVAKAFFHTLDFSILFRVTKNVTAGVQGILNRVSLHATPFLFFTCGRSFSCLICCAHFN